MHLGVRGLLMGVFIIGALIAVGPVQNVHAATFIVNNSGDGHDFTPGNGVCETAFGNGICSLRAAIEEANALGGADTITVPAMTITLTLATTLNAEPHITSDITINGAGAASTIIQTNATFGVANTRVLTVASGGNATISGVTFRYGKVTPPPSPGCVPVNGGGILNSGTLSLTNSVVDANIVALGCEGGGGGIYNTGMLTLNSTNVTDNSDNAGSPDGGGISNDTGGTLIVTGGIFSSNHASQGGGGIGNYGTLTMSTTFIGGNSVDQLGGAGIYSQGTMTLSGITASSNVSTTGCGGGIAAIFNTNTLTNSRVIANQASCGGGIYLDQAAQMTISGSDIGGTTAGYGNTASGSGGGIYNTGTLTLQGGTRILANTANGTTATDGGGGLYNDYDGINAGSGVLVVDASAVGVAGYGNTAHRGGGIYSRGGIVTIRDGSSVSANVGLFGGGGVLNENNDSGTIRGGQVTVDNSVIGGTASGTGNTATPGNSSFGGGILSLTSATSNNTVTLQNNARVQGNLANGGNGGGMYSGGFLNITGSTVSTNSALFGAGIESLTEMVMGTSTVRDNTGICGSGACGGGILAKSDASITQSTISGNGGGGIFVGTGAGMPITNSTISGNGGSGGGLTIGCSSACPTTLTNVTIANNSFGIVGVSGTNGTVAIKNSLLSNLGANCVGAEPITSGDYNISSDGACAALTAPHDRNNLNPQIGPLANNGGPTQTHALLTTSPAIDQIPSVGGCGVGLTTDQRGLGRPQANKGSCDIGAYEKQPDPEPPPQPGPVLGPPPPAPLPQVLRPGPHVDGVPSPEPTTLR
ncbi:MAG: choice-of-anchor Q domain-containing protein [Thermomicrobiales bacterium]